MTGTTISVIRHAEAGDRDRWTAPDDVRPLTRGGRLQAQRIAERLEYRAQLVALCEAPDPRLGWVDVLLAGVLGYGLYFWFSGRMWCRFACPLAALMHIYARFSRFRILADKKKCISCNVCTSVCHQGIDIMSFANKGLPMADVECVRCSACVQSCPTGVLTFGQVDPKTGQVIRTDRLSGTRA